MTPSARLDTWVSGPVYDWLEARAEKNLQTARLLEVLMCAVLFPVYIVSLFIELVWEKEVKSRCQKTTGRN
jgi:hypothetical protein